MSPAPTLPTIIFLQWHGDAEPSESFDPPEESEVTWCRERIFEHDLKYVRADVADNQAGRLAGALDILVGKDLTYFNGHVAEGVIRIQDVVAARKELAAWREGRA